MVDCFALCTVNHNIFRIKIRKFCRSDRCAICNCPFPRKRSDDLYSLCYAHVFI